MLRSLLPLALFAAPPAAADAPPRREPAYRGAPGYLLLKLGPAAAPVWVSFDGERMHFDRNADGDLTNDGEPVAAPADAPTVRVVNYRAELPGNAELEVTVRGDPASGGAGRECSVAVTLPRPDPDGSPLVHRLGDLWSFAPGGVSTLRFSDAPATAPRLRAGGPLTLRFRGGPPPLYAGGTAVGQLEVGCADGDDFFPVTPDSVSGVSETSLTAAVRTPAGPKELRPRMLPGYTSRVELPADALPGPLAGRVELTGWKGVSVAPLEVTFDVRPLPPAPPDPPTPPAASWPNERGATAADVVRFTANGARLVALGRDWCLTADVAARTALRDKLPTAGWTPGLSPDGTLAAWTEAGPNGPFRVRRWDLAARAELPAIEQTLQRRLAHVAPAVAADNRHLVCYAHLGDRSGTGVLDTKTGALTPLVPRAVKGSVPFTFAAEPDAAFVFHGGHLVRLAFPSGAEERRAPVGGVDSLDGALSPDGSRLALWQDTDRRVRQILLIDARTLGRVGSLEAPPVLGGSSGRDAFAGGRRYVALGEDGVLRVWDARSGRHEADADLGIVLRPTNEPRVVASADGRRAAVAWGPERLEPGHPVAGCVAVVDLANPAAPPRILSVPGSRGWAPAVAISPDGSKLAAATWDGVFLYELGQ